MNWQNERMMFNNVADIYDKYRPTYPKPIIDIIINNILNDHIQLLEIGAGSGKATELFINKGYDITCIEPSIKLAEIGQQRFIDKQVKYVVTKFEDYQTDDLYDIILAAQSFHWVEKPKGYQKVYELLKQDGSLVLLWNMYLLTDSIMDQKLKEISDRYKGFADFLTEKEYLERIENITKEIVNTNLFNKPKVYLHKWTITYTVDEYIGFINTGNSFIQNTDQVKQQAYEEIKALASTNGGKIVRPFVCALYITNKK